MYIERPKLEDQYRDHVLGYAELAGCQLDFSEAINEADATFGDAHAMADTLMNMFDAERHERAFGQTGEPGDDVLIRHLAKRTIDGYAGFMEWARRLRSMRVPMEMQNLFRLAAAMMDTLVEEFREYVDRIVTQFDQIPDLMAQAHSDPDITEGNPMVVTVQLTLTIDDHAEQRFNEELSRVETEMCA